MQTQKEFFTETLAGETAIFERVVKAIPAENQDYRPDPKSKTAMEVAAMLIAETDSTTAILKDGVVDFATFKPAEVASADDASSKMVASMNAMLDQAASMTDSQWEEEGRMLMGEHEVWKAPRGKMAWSMLFDMIHHRGQISTHLRAMGGKVPSIYGGSADQEM